MEKTLYCIRHGYALHNKLFWDIGTKAYTEFRDTELLEEGYNQAKHLNEIWEKKHDIDLVIVSPCARTLNTASFIFKNVDVPIIAKDFLIEYPIGGNEICNKRKSLSDLKYLYPFIDFKIKDEEMIWPDNRETVSDLKKRISKMLDWISRRKEKKIAIVSHSSFIGQFKDNKIGDEHHELKHCHPYKLKINYDINGNSTFSIMNNE
tara:strand:- start:44 stop:661 length:618 start_codon:yes stop_codon:yes gene_type:complete